jgi:oxygen-independent coproporphyrinogen-3 oxidase
MPASVPKSDPDKAGRHDTEDAGFGIYVHWPFCLAKCPYCDFNSHVRESVDQKRWGRALSTEIGHFAARTPSRPVTSIFFGGGTPSLMDPEVAGVVIATVAERWGLAEGAEITLEANPTSSEADRFAAFAAAGVNRFSLGVQALDDGDLQRLGRRHSVAEAIAAVEMARRHVPRVSFDLIYARPGQDVAAWRRELAEALALAGDHLSLYQLTIERETAFYGAWKRGELRLPEDAEAEALYDLTQEACAAAGLPAYEVSNHARPGAESRHNLTYWRYGDYVGVGPGAHGRFISTAGRIATRQLRKPEAWLEAVETRGHGGEGVEPIDALTASEEMLMMGLRLAQGVNRHMMAARTGRTIEQSVDMERLDELVAGGFLVLDAQSLRATPRGMKVLNTVLGQLLI